MHILLISPLFPPAVGGAAAYTGLIGPLLASQSEIEQVTVLTEQIPGETPLFQDGKLVVKRALPNRVSAQGQPYVKNVAAYLQTQLWFAARLGRFVKEEGVDLIQFHTRMRGPLVYHALGSMPVPVLADSRDRMIPPKDLIKPSDGMLCCSLGVQKFAIDGGYPAEKTHHITIPLSYSEWPDAEEIHSIFTKYGLPKLPTVLFVGEMTVNKGVFDLVKAFRQWREIDPAPDGKKVQLVFAGPNRVGEEFIELISEIGDVHWIGRVPHADALHLMAGAEVVTLPSRSEGLPRTMLEAVSLGSKVLCPPNIPEFDQYLPEWTLPEISIEAITAGLGKVWASQKRPSYPLEQHDPEVIIRKLVSVYQEYLT